MNCNQHPPVSAIASLFIAVVVFVLSSAVSAAPTDSPGSSHSPDTKERSRYLVRFAAPKSASAPGFKQLGETAFVTQVASAVASVGASVKRSLPEQNLISVELTSSELAALAAAEGVAEIELDPPRYLMAQTVPYGISLVQSNQIAYGAGPGIKVCVVDSGYDLGHPDLPSGSRVTGQAAPDVGNWFEDGTGHGTHVAGSIMALANQEGVIGATNGGDFAVHIYKVFPDESESVSSSDVIAGVQACADAGARVVNLSLGCSGDGCFSAIEERAFERFEQDGLLVVAAAGNDGRDAELGTVPSYPAGYSSVIAVAALDEDSEHAGFSQRYAEVELAAPGVGVNSTVPRGENFSGEVLVALQSFDNNVLNDSPVGSASAPLVNCGIGDSVCASASGAICLIERGITLFVDKARNCEAGGGIGAVIYNNVPGQFFGLLGVDNGLGIPVTGVTDTDGVVLNNLLGQTLTLSVSSVDYGVRSGTSMATPHVAGAAALLWSQVPQMTNTQIRAALQAGALDLGAPGRDPLFGFGLVQVASSVTQLSGDTDGDGQDNSVDNCPLTENAAQTDTDGDAKGDLCDPDIDGDGISNAYETLHSLNPAVLNDALDDQDNDGFSNLAEFYAGTSSSDAASVPAGLAGTPGSGLAAALLPTSRSALVGESITAFATLINSSAEIGRRCSIAPLAPLASGFEFFVTNPQTNAIEGAANEPVDIRAGEAASFITRLTPSASFTPRELALQFGCENLGTAAVIDGVTTLLLSASQTPVPDVVALAATASGDGVMRASTTGAGAFGVASINLGATGVLRVRAESTNPSVPVAISLCPTSATGNCEQPAADLVELTVSAGATPTFSVFVQLGEITAFDPAMTRVRVSFADGAGNVRGATSVAITRAE